MVVSFIDKIKLTDQQILEKYIPLTLKKYNVPGLDDIIDEIKDMREKGYYQRLIDVRNNFDNFYDESVDIDKVSRKTAEKGCEVLGNQIFNLPPFTRVIACQDLESVYNFLAGVYVMYTDKKLNQNQLKRIYDNLDIRIIKKLDQFDNINSKPVINDNFFHDLRNVKWKNKKSRFLWLDINELLKFMSFTIIQAQFKFYTEQWLVTQFLAACSAVNNNRSRITDDDVIVAFRTYFKLLETDMLLLVQKLKKVDS